MYTRYYVFTLLILLSFSHAYAEKKESDITLLDPELSIKYNRGPVLVFDCIDDHWVCTAELEANNCKRLRAEDIKNNDMDMSCGVVKKFKTEKNCTKYQANLVNRFSRPRFCMHPESRKKIKNL